MPPEGKTGLTIADETFEQLKDDKADGVNWDYYLLQMHRAYLQVKEGDHA